MLLMFAEKKLCILYIKYCKQVMFNTENHCSNVTFKKICADIGPGLVKS